VAVLLHGLPAVTPSLGTRPVLVLAVGWLIMSWAPIVRVYESGIPNMGGMAKDDWRGVTQLISTTACPDAGFYVNIPDHYQFGIGYYNPKLLPRTQFLTSPTGNLSDLMVGSFGPHDWLVVLVYGPGVGSLDQLSSTMTASGWTEHDFTAIRAYQHGVSCGTRPSP